MVLVVDENKPCDFMFVWTIHNFFYWMGKEEEYLESPTFSTKGGTWRLRFYPKGSWVPGTFDFYLELVSKDTPSPIEINCALGIRGRDRIYMKVDNKQFHFKSTGVEGFSKFLIRDQVIEKQRMYLQNNNLVLRCRIWKCGNATQETTHCYASTRLQVTKITKTWKLDKFMERKCDRTVIKEPSGTYVPSLTIELSPGGSRIEEVLNLSIRQKDVSLPHLMVLKASLIDADQALACSVEKEFWLEESEGEQNKSLQFISKQKLLSRKDFYLPNNVLTLHLEFVFSFGGQVSEIEKVDHGPVSIRKENGPEDAKGSESVVDTWMGHWIKLLDKGKFSDVILRTSDKDLHAHKTFLAAQSEVFCEKFQSDPSDIVKICHLDIETVTRMLKFIYTCSTGALEWDIALKLFNAATEFKILALQNMCALFFSDNFTVTNVCDVLVLAFDAKHAMVKLFAKNFIMEHSDEVFNSDNWTELNENRKDITSELMLLHYRNK